MIRRSSDPRRARRPGRRGQALVEFALVAPIFFLVLFAIIETGRFIFYYEVLNNATREGARYAIVHGEQSFDKTGPPDDPSGADVISAVRRAAIGMVGSSVTVTPTWGGSPPNNQRGTTVTVHASYSYTTLVPIVPLPAISVEAESSLVVNN